MRSLGLDLEGYESIETDRQPGSLAFELAGEDWARKRVGAAARAEQRTRGRQASIDAPQPGVNEPGFIDSDDGANIRTGPADLPEPTAKLYQIKPGDTAEGLAVQELAAAARDGHDLRYYENVLLSVNHDTGRAGGHGWRCGPAMQRMNIL